jgi:tetratricopeptide (TPR) repeat protein
MTKEPANDQLERCLKKVEANPESAAAHFNLGLAYTHKGRMSSAETFYRKALELDPGLVEGWVNLGGTLLLKWDFEGARDANLEALKLKDDLLLAHYNLGQAALYLGDAELVESSNRRVVEIDPDHAAGHYFLAVGLLALNRVEEARAALANAMRLGHRPTTEFLKGLEKAEKQLLSENENNVTHIGAEAPEDSKEK